MKFEKESANKAFVIICATAPTSGVVVGGIFVQKVLNGYESKHSITFVCFQLLLCSVFILPIYFFESLFTISLMLWLLLFFGGSVVPILQGISISTLPHSLRASGNSLCNLSIYTFGFAFAPLFYGTVFDLTKDFDPKMSFVVTLCWGVVSFVASLLCAMFRFQRFEDPTSQEVKNLISNLDKTKDFLEDIPNVNSENLISENSIDLNNDSFKKAINYL